MAELYRISRTTKRGQYASDDCFRAWFGELPIDLVDGAEDPGNDGGPNDHTFYLWKHDASVTVSYDTEKCPWDLMTYGGANGWRTEAEARAVLDEFIGLAANVKETVDAANKAAVDPVKLAKDAATAAAKDAADVVEAAADVTPMWVKAAGALAGLIGVGWVVRSFWRPK